jgi:serine/threonine-protein kinase RsbW
MKRSSTCTITSSLHELSKVGEAVRVFLSEPSLSETEIYELELCVIEAVSNCIRHAYRGAPGNFVEIEMIAEPGTVTFIIFDIGRAWQSPLQASLEYDPEDRDNLPENGMGVYLIKQIMDDIEYSSQGGKNVLRMIKKLP